MKKLSLLITLIVCVTIGGVYATWNYAQGNVTAQQKFFDASTVITNKVISTAKGTISIDTSNLNIVIDDTDGNYQGELAITGKVTVTFEPNEGADSNVIQNGIKMKYSLSQTENFTYNGNAIFTVDSTEQKIGTEKFTFDIDAATLESLITLNSLSLPTSDTYDAFKTALHSGAISITVSEDI